MESKQEHNAEVPFCCGDSRLTPLVRMPSMLSATRFDTLRRGSLEPSDEPSRAHVRVERGNVDSIMRWLLVLYVTLVACPMRFWMIRDSDLDYTWVFALNYGAVHGMSFGRDLQWTTGPLSYLTFPQNMGHNLVQGLLFQAVLWAVLAITFADRFLHSGIPLRRLIFFSLAVGCASPLFWFFRNTEPLYLMAALILLVMVRFHGGTIRYVTALVIIGIIPFIKLSGGLQASLALSGFLVVRVMLLRWRAWRDVVLAFTVPTVTAAVVLWLTIPSWDALRKFVRGSIDLLSGYNAMTEVGPQWELVAALALLVAMAVLVCVTVNQQTLRFFALLLGPSLLFRIKHGFVRQDEHIVNFFCFAILTLGLVALYTDFHGWRKCLALAVIVLPFVICLPHLVSYQNVLADVSGLRAFRAIWLAWRSATAGQSLAEQRAVMGTMAPGPSVEPEILAIVKDSTVAFLSYSYSAAYFDRLNLQIYPVLQRYSAYTPYLDGLNAEWTRNQGPQFLIFDGSTIDKRHPWAETPAMWLEVYRNYDTRLLTRGNLLLERRHKPRFNKLETIESFTVPMPGQLDLPPSDTAAFWSFACGLTSAGSLRNFLFRVPAVTMTVERDDGSRKEYRSITEVLTTPVMGTWLPDTLAEFAEVFASEPVPHFQTRKLTFGGLGANFYQSNCQARLLQPVL
jgi:hypothetical protein